MNKKIFYRIINILCLAIMIGSLVWLIAYWKNIPDEIATHFNLYGEADNFGSKKDIIVLPIFAWLTYGMMSLVECIPGAWNTGVKVTPENSARVYSIIKGMLVTLKLFVVLTFTLITVFSAIGTSIPILFLPVELIGIFGTIIISLIRLYRAR
ncbi:MAG: DUF1648 domain-containing protein [Lachnospiraceae bacterium]|nr:DUF1648 domain-containing protein [Lachnospiraceae bacterium]